MKLMGHRGAKGEYPENTLGGFQYAIEMGVGAIEFDVHLTQDGECVVIHDETLERTTNGQGYVSKHSLEQLKKLDAGKGEKIPTLKEALELIRKCDGIECQIELKSAGLEQIVMDTVNELNMRELSSIISFNHRHLVNVRNLDEKIKVFPLIYGLPINVAPLIEPLKAQGLSISIHTVDQKLIEQCHAQKHLVTVWNVNNLDDYQKFKEWNVDYAGTDYPSLFKK